MIFLIFTAHGEGESLETTTLSEQRQYCPAISHFEKNQTSQHQRQRLGGWETTSRAWTYMDDYTLFPSK